MRIYHVATKTDWEAAMRGGSYTTSTRGRTLEQEGFIHAAREEQVPGVLALFYGDVTEPLVVLEIETDGLGVPWREDQVDDETFPHIYGPLPTRAVVDVRPVPARPAPTAGKSRLPPPPQVAVFNGLAFVLAVMGLALFLSGVLAHQHAGASLHADPFRTAQFVLWSLTVVALTGALTSWAIAGAQLNRHRDLTTWSG
jgi:uncharacterized protein (DUF952 family)